MRTSPVKTARAEFSQLIDRALAGEPQRVTRNGKDAVVIVSEADWLGRPKAAGSLGSLLADHAEVGGFGESETARSWSERCLGVGFE